MLVKALPLAPGQREVTLIPGDIHFDQQDDAAVDLMLRVARHEAITRVVLVGDTFESAGISRHSRPGRKFRFARGTVLAERRAAEPVLEALALTVFESRGAPGGLHVLTGNHEKWWEGVQDDYPGLEDTPWFELYGELFDGWHIYREYTALKLGPLLICHGHRLRGGLARYPAASVLSNYPGQNTLFGHTHRVDSCTLPTFKYGKSVDHGAWTVGHLKDLRAEITDPNIGPHAERHKQGFALVYHHEVKREFKFNVVQVTIDRTKRGRPFCLCNGRKYE